MAAPKNKATIFIDSDVFVAFIKKDDSLHVPVRRVFQRLQEKQTVFCTSNYVFAEVVTVLSQRVSHELAVKFIEALHAPDADIEVQWVDIETEARAIGIFRRQTSKNVSFVDCVNMAIVQIHGIDAIFSFDAVYKKNNLRTVEELF